MKITRIPITTTAWTAIIVPYYCGNIWLRNDTDDTKIRSNVADASTEDVFKATIQFVSNNSFYKQNDIFCYVQAVNVNSTLIAIFA